MYAENACTANHAMLLEAELELFRRMLASYHPVRSQESKREMDDAADRDIREMRN